MSTNEDKAARALGPSGPRVAALLAELRSMGSERNRAGMARYGVNVQNAFGVSIFELRKLARRRAERGPPAANRRAGAERGGDPSARSARWVASDALRELTSDKVRARVAKLEAKGRRQAPSKKQR